MDCDGLKKALVIDTDGTLFGRPSSVFSQAEALWGMSRERLVQSFIVLRTSRLFR